MKFVKILTSIFLSISILASCIKSTNDKPIVTIATAANMQFAMKALTEAFTETTNVDCQLVISSSGKLTAQIQEGAPFDIFVAADMKYPTTIYEKGKAQTPPKIYAYGQLVLWTMKEGLNPSLKHLTNKNIQHIAIANPQTAPYGAAAMDVLQQLDGFEIIKEKLVYGESIAQTNQFITLQSADIGFTAMSVVKSPKMNGKGQWTSIDFDYQPITQGVVLLKNTKTHNQHAQQFYDFLFSEKAQNILSEFGYILPMDKNLKDS